MRGLSHSPPANLRTGSASQEGKICPEGKREGGKRERGWERGREDGKEGERKGKREGGRTFSFTITV